MTQDKECMHQKLLHHQIELARHVPHLQQTHCRIFNVLQIALFQVSTGLRRRSRPGETQNIAG